MSKLLRVLVFGLCMLSVPVMVAKAENGVGISDNKNGTVTVTYENESQAKIAVTVKKQGTSSQYNYFLQEAIVEVAIPLTGGNGVYDVAVLKNIEDSKYSPLTSQEVVLELVDSKSAYLTSNKMLDWNQKNAAIKKANKLVKKCKNQNAKIKTIYSYLVKNFHYDYDKYSENSSGNLSYYTPNISDTYKTKKGICYDMSALSASMLRSVGIQTKMITGYPQSRYFNGQQYHAWNKVFSKKNKDWIIVDVTCDMCLYEQGVKFSKLSMKKKASEYSNVKYEW